MLTMQIRFLLTALLCFLPACFAYHDQDVVKKISIVSDSGQVHSDILQLLQLTGVQHDGTLTDIIAQTQDCWLRKPGTERWDIVAKSIPNSNEINQILKGLGLTSQITPPQKSYDYAFVLGAILSTMIIRMQYLVDLWNQGVRFDRIVLLAGARAANPQQGETKEAVELFAKQSINVEPQTETDLIKLVYRFTQMPEAMRTVPVEIVDVPMLTNQDGSIRRPNTADTIKHWLKKNVKPGTILAISNQPYVSYQESVLRSLLPTNYTVDTVGAHNNEANFGVLLDTLARILYQEKLRLKL